MSEAKITLSAEDRTRAAFADVRRNLLSLRESAEQVNQTFGATAAVLGSAFAGLTLTGFIKATVDGVDALNDLKDATGSSIENISALENIALRTGGSIDTVSSALVKFNAVLSGADEGSQAAASIQALGLSVQQLRAEDPAEALRQVAVALAGFADDANKARVVQELFGKSVREVAPFLADLAQAGSLNATVTAQQAAEAEKFNQQLSRLNANSTQLARALLGEIVPALNQTADAFRGVAPNGEQSISQLLTVPLQALSVLGANVVFVFKQVGNEIGGIAAQAALLLQGDFRGAWKLGEILRRDAATARQELEELEKRLLSIGVAAAKDPRNDPRIGRGYSEPTPAPSLRVPELPDRNRRPAAAATPRSDPMGPDVPEALQSVQRALAGTDAAKLVRLREELEALTKITAAGTSRPEVFEAINTLVEQINALDPAYQAAVAQQERFNQLMAATPTAKLEQARADMQLLAQAYEDGRLGLVGSEEAVRLYSEAVQAALGTTAEKVQETAGNLDEFAKGAARNIQNALGDTLRRTLSGDFDSIGELWRNLLIDMAAQAAAAQLGRVLLGDFATTGNVGGLLGEGIGFLLGIGRAHGGPVGARSLQRVNENGFEVYTDPNGGDWLMTGARGGTVTPANQVRGASGQQPAGAVVHVVNNVSGGMQRNEVFQLLQITQAQTEASIMRSLRQMRVIPA